MCVETGSDRDVSEGSIAACNSTTGETGKVDGRCHNLDQAVARGINLKRETQEARLVKETPGPRHEIHVYTKFKNEKG